MPGTIRVSVLEAVDLPESFTDGTVKDVTAKVTLGTKQFVTQSRVAVEGRIQSWNSDFVFLVTNLRDKLVVAICDNEDQCLTQTSIEVPSIIEKGCRDEFVELKGGGRIHLNMSFVLTDEERKKIETMRVRVLKRREEERVKRTIFFQNVESISENELKAATVPAVTITEIDDSTTHESKDSQECANGPLGFGSTTMPLKPVVMFDYARAVGLQSKHVCRRTEKRSKLWAADIENVEGCIIIDKINGCCVLGIVLSFSQDPTPRKGTVGAVKLQAEGRDEPRGSANDYTEDRRGIEGQQNQIVLEAKAALMANSFSDQSILVDEHIRSGGFHRGSKHMPLYQSQNWDRQQAIRAASSHKDIPRIECPSGQGLKLEPRPGPGARWAQKTGLETRWTSPAKATQRERFEWNGQVSDPFKARAKILKLIKATSGSHEVCNDDQRLEDRHNLANSIGVVFNKVVSGAAILLVALFMMSPIPEVSPFGTDCSDEDETHNN